MTFMRQIYLKKMREIFTQFLFSTFISVTEEEVRHVRSAEKPPCNEDVLIEFLAEAQITNPESIVGIAITDFDATCRSTGTIIKKIDRFLKNCTASPSLYLYLLNGLKTFDEKLCKNNEFYKKYDIYDKCISDLDNDFDSCDGMADWNEDEDEAKVCRTYKKIVSCYYIKTAKVCGIKAALTLKELMVEVMDCTLTVKCNVGDNPPVKDAMPDKYVDSLTNKARLYISIIKIRSFIKPTIDWLLNQRFPSDNFSSSMGSGSGDRLVQWCHGAPGFVPFNGQVTQH